VIATGVMVAVAASVIGLTTPTPSGGFTPNDPQIDEASGMVVSRDHVDTVWIANDSGDPARLFAVDTNDGHTRGVVTLAGARNVDWEALAISSGPSSAQLWVGDIGDNDAVRSSIRVYRLPEPPTSTGEVTDWTSYDFVYPDGAHDAETLLVDPRDDRLYVVTKGLLGGAVYEAPEVLHSDRVNALTLIGSAPLLVTDGAFRSDGSVVLRNYLNGFVRDDVTGRSRPFSLPRQRQGETLAVIGAGQQAYVGSEGAGTAVLRVTLPPLTHGPSSSGAGSSTSPSATTSSSGRTLSFAVTLGLVAGIAAVGLVVVRRRRRQT